MPLHTFLLNTLCIITIALAVPLSASAYFGSGSNGANAGNNGSGNTSGGTTKSSSGGGADSSAKSTSGDKGAGVKSSSGGGGDNKPSGGGGNSYNGGYGSGGGNTGGGGGINNGSKGSTNNTPNSARDGRGGQPPSGKDPATGGGGGINNGSKGSTNNTPNSARDGRGGQPPSGKDPATGGGGGILGTISKVVTSLREATLGTVRSVGQGVLDAAKKAAGIPASDKYTTLSEITQRPKTVATVPKTTTDQINGETRPTPKPSVQVPDNVKSAIDAQKKANGGLTDAQVKEYEQMNLEEAKRGFQKELTERAAGVFEEKARAEVYKAQDAADQAEAGVNKMKADPDAGQGEIAQAQAAADRARAQADQVIAEYNKNKGVESAKTAVQKAEASLGAIKADPLAGQGEISRAQATVDVAKANLAKVESGVGAVETRKVETNLKPENIPSDTNNPRGGELNKPATENGSVVDSLRKGVPAPYAADALIRTTPGITVKPGTNLLKVEQKSLIQLYDAVKIEGVEGVITAGFTHKGHKAHDDIMVDGVRIDGAKTPTDNGSAIDFLITSDTSIEKQLSFAKTLSALGATGVGPYKNTPGLVHFDNLNRRAWTSDLNGDGKPGSADLPLAGDAFKEFGDIHLTNGYQGYNGITAEQKPQDIDDSAPVQQAPESTPKVPAKQNGFGDLFRSVTGFDVDAVTQKAKEAAKSVADTVEVIKSLDKWNALPSWMQGIAKALFSSTGGKAPTNLNDSSRGDDRNGATSTKRF